jgi:PAS domain S-box-containing protein
MQSKSIDELEFSFYRELFELSPIPTGVFGIEGECYLVNRAFSNRIGHSRHDLLSGACGFSELFDQTDQVHELLEQIQNRKVIRRLEMHLKTRDGYTFNALISARLLRYSDKPAFEFTFIDISHHRNLQRQTQKKIARLESLLENLSLGLFLVDREGKISEANLALGNLLGFEAHQLISQPYHNLFAQVISAALEPDVVQKWLGSAVKEIMESPTLEFTLQDNGIRHLEFSFFPIWDEQGQSLGWGGLLQDITDMREQTAWKLELLSVLSHDIRTPLATLKGHATALLANYQGWSDEMVIEFLEAINRSVDELVHQVDRNLALTRVESGRLGLRPEAVTVESIVNQALERAAGVLREMPVEVEIPGDIPRVRVDPARTEEILMNLLENAVRFNPPDKPLIIRAHSDSSRVQISLIDHGPGVPLDRQQKIFEKYERQQGLEGGTGLGLFISRKIAEAQGGKIWVTSPPQGAQSGAQFTFTVPIMPEKVQSKPVEKAVDKAATDPLKRKKDTGQRILVVEDEADMQTLLYTILSQEGYQVEMAPDGPSAINIMQTSPADLVLLDWMMPGMDGMAVCRNIRRWSSVPIIIVTSRTAEEDLIAALDAGADDYVTKPFLGDELLARMRALMRRGERWTLEKEPDQFRVDGLLIDFESFEVWVDDQPLELTPTEFELLAYMVRHKRQVLTYDQLIEHLWGYEGEGSRHSLFVHISRLRSKIEEDPKNPRFIQTRWGIGYSFVPD